MADESSYEVYVFVGGNWRLHTRIERARERAIAEAERELAKPTVEGAIVVKETFDEARGVFLESRIYRKAKREDLPRLGETLSPAAAMRKPLPAAKPARPRPAAAPAGDRPATAVDALVRATSATASLAKRPEKKREKEQDRSLLTLVLGAITSKVIGGDDDRRDSGERTARSGGRRIGRYDIVSELGKGAMGVVYKAYDPVIDRTVAIKTINKDLVDDQDNALSRLRREAQSAGRLNHPNIVAIYDYGENDKVAYIAMEFIDGRPLNDILGERRLSPNESLEMMLQLLSALDYSHERKVIHRDIKPANIMLLADGQIKITDFGIARVESSTLTQSGTLLGTPAYMSPEQVKGLPADARSDLFSTGVVLYELLTGQRPFTGAGATLVYQILNHMPPRVSQLDSRLPSALSDVVEKAIAKDPADRFASARDFARAIEEVAGKFRTLKPTAPATENQGPKRPWYDRLTCEAGMTVFAEGDPGDACYVVESGSVEVIKTDPAGKEIVLATVGRGQVIGEMALMDNQPRMATVRAREDSVLLVIPREAFQARLEKLDPVTRRLLDTFADRIRRLSDEVVRLHAGKASP